MKQFLLNIITRFVFKQLKKRIAAADGLVIPTFGTFFVQQNKQKELTVFFKTDKSFKAELNDNAALKLIFDCQPPQS